MENNVYDILKKLEIEFEEKTHEAVYTIEEAKNISNMIDGIGCKSLFLTNKKGKYVLLVIEEEKKANIKLIEKIVNVKHLSFASEEDLKNILGVDRGSCGPFGIINDKENIVTILIDMDLKGQKLLLPPNIKTATISVDFNDLIKFLNTFKHDYILKEL